MEALTADEMPSRLHAARRKELTHSFSPFHSERFPGLPKDEQQSSPSALLHLAGANFFGQGHQTYKKGFFCVHVWLYPPTCSFSLLPFPVFFSSCGKVSFFFFSVRRPRKRQRKEQQRLAIRSEMSLPFPPPRILFFPSPDRQKEALLLCPPSLPFPSVIISSFFLFGGAVEGEHKCCSRRQIRAAIWGGRAFGGHARAVIPRRTIKRCTLVWAVDPH